MGGLGAHAGGTGRPAPPDPAETSMYKVIESGGVHNVAVDITHSHLFTDVKATIHHELDEQMKAQLASLIRAMIVSVVEGFSHI